MQNITFKLQSLLTDLFILICSRLTGFVVIQSSDKRLLSLNCLTKGIVYRTSALKHIYQNHIKPFDLKPVLLFCTLLEYVKPSEGVGAILLFTEFFYLTLEEARLCYNYGIITVFTIFLQICQF